MISKERQRQMIQYQKENLKRIPLSVSKDFYTMLKEAATISNMSINGFIKSAIEEKARKTIRSASPFRSHFSDSLYDLISASENNKIELSVDDLRCVFDLSGPAYDRWFNIRARALDPAVREINEMTDVRLSYRTVQAEKGKTIAGISLNWQ